MDVVTLRTLDTLVRTLGSSPSIRRLANDVEELHGTGHYPNVHRALQGLETQGIVAFEQAGRTKVPRLRLGVGAARRALTHLELWRSQRLLAERPDLEGAVERLVALGAKTPGIASILLVDAVRNAKLRRLEPLIVLAPSAGTGKPGARRKLAGDIGALARTAGLRVDPCMLTADELADILTDRRASPAGRLVRRGTCVWAADTFWYLLGERLPANAPVAAPELATPLAELPADLVARGLAAAGYVERGRTLPQSAVELRPECVAVAAVAAADVRWRAAAALVLAREAWLPAFAAYLAKANDQGPHVMGVLVAARGHMPPRARERVDETVGILAALGIEEETFDDQILEDLLETYHGR